DDERMAIALAEPADAFRLAATTPGKLDVVERIEALLGHPVARQHEPVRTGDVRHSQAANDRLMALFPDAQPVSFDEGLAATLAWMRSTRTEPNTRTDPATQADLT
ncbi:MAG: hypothetical protein ABMA25_13040, partial [Ilumatobacteraceae bacterium]